MGNVVDIEEAMPHVLVVGKNNEAHIMPHQLIIDVIERRTPLTDIEDWEDFMPELIADWFSRL